MNTRRLYLTSRDSNPRVIYNDKVQIDLSKANLNVESNQKMGLSIVRATLPPTLEAVPRTIASLMVPCAPVRPQTCACKLNLNDRQSQDACS